MTASVCRQNMANLTKRCEEILKSETNGNTANLIHDIVCEVKTCQAVFEDTPTISARVDRAAKQLRMRHLRPSRRRQSTLVGAKIST